MHEQAVVLDGDERSACQPVDQLVAVRRRENRVERVVAMRPAVAGRDA